MALSTAIKTILTNDTTITAFVEDRIYPGIAPFNVNLPFIVVKIGNKTVDRNKSYDFDWTKCDIEIDVVSKFYTDTETYADLIRVALNRVDGTVDSEIIDTIIYEGETAEYYERLTEGGTTTGQGVFERQINFTLIKKG
jgi:hypothetical protein